MEKVFKIEGMSCQHCVAAVKKVLQKLDVKNLNVKIGEAVIDFDENKLNEEKIKNAVKEAGYTVVS